MKQLMKQFLPLGWRQPIERITGSIGEGASKSQDLLKLCAGVQLEVIAWGCSRGSTPTDGRSSSETLIARSNPN